MQNQTVAANDGTSILLEYDGTYSYACRGSGPECGLNVHTDPRKIGQKLDVHCDDWHGGIRLPRSAAQISA